MLSREQQERKVAQMATLHADKYKARKVKANERFDQLRANEDAFVDRVEFAAQQAVVGFARQMDAGQAGRFGLDLEELLGRNA